MISAREFHDVYAASRSIIAGMSFNSWTLLLIGVALVLLLVVAELADGAL